MMINYRISIFFLVIFCISCQEEDARVVAPDIRSLDFEGDFTPTSELLDIFEVVDLIQLEKGNSNAYFQRCEKLLVADSHFIIHEKTYDLVDNLLFFNYQGILIAKRSGDRDRGPGSIRTVSDMSFDQQEKSLLVLSRMPRKVSFFDLKGELLRESNLESQSAYSILPTKSKYFVMVNDQVEDFFIHVYDRRFNLIDRVIAHEEAFAVVGGQTCIFELDVGGQAVIFKHWYSDTLYTIDVQDNSCSASLIFKSDHQRSNSNLGERVIHLFENGEPQSVGQTVMQWQDSTYRFFKHKVDPFGGSISIVRSKEAFLCRYISSDGNTRDVLVNSDENTLLLRLILPHFIEGSNFYYVLTYEELKNYVESAREKGVDLKELFAKDEIRNRLASILTESPEGQNDIIMAVKTNFGDYSVSR